MAGFDPKATFVCMAEAMGHDGTEVLAAIEDGTLAAWHFRGSLRLAAEAVMALEA